MSVVPRRYPSRPPDRPERTSLKQWTMVAVILVLLCGCVGIGAMSGLFDRNGEPVVVERSDVFVPSAVVVSEEPSEESSSLQFEPAGAFQNDYNRLSVAVRKKLVKDITSQYVVLYDVTGDKVLFEKNGSKKCYPASTTKMLTAIVACRIIDPDTVLTVGDEIKLIGEESSRAGLLVGMKFPFRALLDALLLPSGNDAAYTIAVNAARIYQNNPTLSDKEAVEVFVGLMNQAAVDLKCEGTHFVNPDGWHEDDHYTTAQDLIKIAAAAIKVPLIKESCKKTYAKWDIVQEEKEESSAKSSVSPQSSAAEHSAAASETSKKESSTAQASSQKSQSSEKESNVSDKPGKEISEKESKSASEPSHNNSRSDAASKPSTTAASPEASVEAAIEPDPLRYDPKTFGTTIEWYSSNSMLYKDSGMYSPYADGVKTGFTDEAGTSVVASATINGHTFIAAAMDGKNVYEKYHDVHMLFTEGFNLYKLKYTYDS